MKTNKDVENKIWFNDISNKFRNINHIYYGYQNLNENYRLKNELEMTFNKNISQSDNLHKIAEDEISQSLCDLKEILKLISHKKLFRYKYQKFKILSNFTFGQTKKRFIDKKNKYKHYLDTISEFEYGNY